VAGGGASRGDDRLVYRVPATQFLEEDVALNEKSLAISTRNETDFAFTTLPAKLSIATDSKPPTLNPE